MPGTTPIPPSRNKSFTNEKEQMSHAKVFDNLVMSNLALVKTSQRAIFVCTLGVLTATILTAYSAYTLRMGHLEMRDMISHISRECHGKI